VSHVSILLGVIFGARILSEKAFARRLVGAVVIVAGVLALTFG
jgi:uncharacterized membrane protein